MSGEPTEREMLERLVDATREAGDIVQKACARIKVGAPVQPRAMVDLQRHLRQASGCAHQLFHAQQRPDFLELRDQLEMLSGHMRQVSLNPTPQLGMVMARVGEALDMLWRHAKKAADSAAVARQEVLDILDRRQTHH